MTHLIVGAVFFFACYGVLTAIEDTLRRIGNRRLRRLGHDLEDCEICSGRLKRQHIRSLERWLITPGDQNDGGRKP